jgi:hypothetical protein
MQGIGRHEGADLAEATCLAGKFIESSIGEAYDALAKGLNRKIQICGGGESGASRCGIGSR